MNREILFRGKDLDTGKWIEGYGCIQVPGMYLAHIIHKSSINIHQHSEIDPRTLCQYIGLTDKNGTKIFEGDTLDNGYAVQMEDGRWLARKGISVIEAEYFCNFEITGTIHD